MPRCSNTKLTGRMRHGLRTNWKSNVPLYRNFFIVMNEVTGTGYIERYMHREPKCTYAEYYTVDNGTTHNLYAYLQTKRTSVATMLGQMNCKTIVTPTTIAAKAKSSFASVEPKIRYGIESINEEQSLIGVASTAELNAPLHTVVKIAPKPVPTNAACWLTQPPKIDCLLNRKRIYPINYEES